jgi:hypothetical protein
LINSSELQKILELEYARDEEIKIKIKEMREGDGMAQVGVTIPKLFRIDKENETRFNKEKRLLHQYYKRLKVGMIKFESIPKKYRALLIKYYGVEYG